MSKCMKLKYEIEKHAVASPLNYCLVLPDKCFLSQDNTASLTNEQKKKNATWYTVIK